MMCVNGYSCVGAGGYSCTGESSAETPGLAGAAASPWGCTLWMKMLRGVSQHQAALQASEMRRRDGEQTLALLLLLAIHGEDHPWRRRSPLLRHLHWEVFREKRAFAITPCPTQKFLPIHIRGKLIPSVTERPSAHQAVLSCFTSCQEQRTEVKTWHLLQLCRNDPSPVPTDRRAETMSLGLAGWAREGGGMLPLGLQAAQCNLCPLSCRQGFARGHSPVLQPPQPSRQHPPAGKQQPLTLVKHIV